jgi:hypothetical protein
LIALLPDEPRWVEVRSMLLSGRGHVFHVASTSPPSFVVLEPGTRTGAIVGGPSPAAIEEMASQADEILAEPERVEWVARALRGWTHETATIFQLGIRQMRAAGKQPVWGAYESNVASAALAHKLGFVPVDTIAVFTRP